MITDKKGLSTIVATLIIILLVLVAIGIVWVVVKGLIGNTEGQIDIQKKCLGIDLEITSVTCVVTSHNLPCTVVVRETGAETPVGIKSMVYATDGSVLGSKSAPAVEPDTTLSVPYDTGKTGAATKVSAVAYFGTDANPEFCPQVVESTTIK